MGLNPARRIGKLRELAERGHWSDIVDLTEDLAPTDGRAIFFRALAALELNNERVRWSVAELCGLDGAAPEIAFAIASRFVKEGEPAAAWRIITRLSLESNRATWLMLGRLQSCCDDPAIRKSVRDVLRALKRMPRAVETKAASDLADVGGEAAPSEDMPVLDSPYQFPVAAASEPPREPVLTVIRTDRVSPRQEADYRQLIQRFDQILEDPPEPRVIELRDVLVNRDGQAWRPDGTIVRSRNHQLPPPSTWGEWDTLDEAVLCTDGTRGFYHWYAERLPSLAWRLTDSAPNYPILIGDHASPFQDDMFRLLGHPPEAVKRIGDAIYCRRVFVAHASVQMLARWSRFSAVYDRLSVAADAECPDIKRPPYIYISRRDTERRRLINEIELEARLRTIGITPVVLSELPLAAQISIVKAARFVIAPHGAGLSHIVLSAPGLTVLELLPSQMGSNFLRLTFARLSQVKGHRHTLWLESINPLTREWTVDIDAVCAKVEAMKQEIG